MSIWGIIGTLFLAYKDVKSKDENGDKRSFKDCTSDAHDNMSNAIDNASSKTNDQLLRDANSSGLKALAARKELQNRGYGKK